MAHEGNARVACSEAELTKELVSARIEMDHDVSGARAVPVADGRASQQRTGSLHASC